MERITRPDEVLHFASDMSIELNYRNTLTYTNCKVYDAQILAKGYIWHQIVVLHLGKIVVRHRTRDILEAIFNAVDGEEFYPIAYRHGTKEDRFLVRQCQAALDKLFAQNLRVQLKNAMYIPLQVQLNVGEYKFGQISAIIKMEETLNRLYENLERSSTGMDSLLNLSQFGSNKELKDVVVNLGNRSVFARLCKLIYRNGAKFRTFHGLVLRYNSITTLAPLQEFNGTEFDLLDLRDNMLSSTMRLCTDLKSIKVTELFLAGNPFTKSSNYPENLKSIIKNFKSIDGIPIENLSKDYTPMSYDVDVQVDGYRIDWTNKSDLYKFEKSDKWHAVMIPDSEEEFTKEEIIDYFFITVSPDCSEIYPCYYKFIGGEHQFLVRQCFDQLKYLVNNCNLEIKIPRLAEPLMIDFNDYDYDGLQQRVQIEKTVVYFLRMNVGDFNHGHIDPKNCIDMALTRRFSPMDRLLNLENFQDIEGMENIIVNLSSTNILNRVLIQAARKYVTNCVELRLGRNKILNGNFHKALSIMTKLKAIDLGNNWISDLSDVEELQKLSLTSLRLDGNPLCAKYSFPSDYIRDVKKIFPQITKLDNVDITSRGNLNTQKNFLCDIKGYDFVQQFITNFFHTFDSCDRMDLRDLYYEKAQFTMTCNYVTAKSSSMYTKRISKYVVHARNIFKISDLSRAFTSVHVGPEEIMQVFMQLPLVSHDMLTFATDTTIFDDNMIVITVNGVFLDQTTSAEDADLLMAFTRTFILKPVQRNLGVLKCSTSYKVVNEQLSVYNPTPLQIKNSFKYIKSADKPNTNDLAVIDKEASLIMLQEVTGLKPIWCTRCLEDAKWEFSKALDIFSQLCVKKEIPDAAFV